MQVDELNRRVKLARKIAIVTVIFGVAFYTIGDLIKPGYSSISSFISELNATGTEWATVLGYFGFIPLGLLFATFLTVAGPVANVQGMSRIGWFLLWSQPIAFIGVALAPCDAGCPVEGSTSQDMHNLLSVVTYFSCAAGIFIISFAPALAGSSSFARRLLRVAGVGFLVLFIIMLIPEVASVRGVIQRLADALLATSLLTISWCILSTER